MAKGRKTGGRVKGTPNKTTTSAREAFQHAFDAIGGVSKLAEWALGNQSEFYRLYARLIPVQLATDENSQPLPLVITLTADAHATPDAK